MLLIMALRRMTPSFVTTKTAILLEPPSEAMEFPKYPILCLRDCHRLNTQFILTCRSWLMNVAFRLPQTVPPKVSVRYESTVAGKGRQRTSSIGWSSNLASTLDPLAGAKEMMVSQEGTSTRSALRKSYTHTLAFVPSTSAIPSPSLPDLGID